MQAPLIIHLAALFTSIFAPLSLSASSDAIERMRASLRAHRLNFARAMNLDYKAAKDEPLPKPAIPEVKWDKVRLPPVGSEESRKARVKRENSRSILVVSLSIGKRGLTN